MKIKKEDIINSLSLVKLPGDNINLIESKLIKNIVVFGDEVIIDLEIKNPSLQYRKKIEVDILKIIHQKVYKKAKIKINVSIDKSKTESLNTKPKIKDITSIIAISSGKGGVGKSTIASNISVELAKMGFSVGILDADIYGPSIPLMMDVENMKPLSIKEGDKVKIKPIENYSVKILSIGFFTKPSQAVIWRGPMAAKALNQMIFDSAWGKLDFLIVDLPPGTGDIHLSIVQSLPLDGAVVISTPQNVALEAARKGISMFTQENINIPVLGIIEYMSYFSPKEFPNKKYFNFG